MMRADAYPRTRASRYGEKPGGRARGEEIGDGRSRRCDSRARARETRIRALAPKGRTAKFREPGGGGVILGHEFMARGTEEWPRVACRHAIIGTLLHLGHCGSVWCARVRAPGAMRPQSAGR